MQDLLKYVPTIKKYINSVDSDLRYKEDAIHDILIVLNKQSSVNFSHRYIYKTVKSYIIRNNIKEKKIILQNNIQLNTALCYIENVKINFSQREKQIIFLRKLNYKYHEIADILNLSEGYLRFKMSVLKKEVKKKIYGST